MVGIIVPLALIDDAILDDVSLASRSVVKLYGITWSRFCLPASYSGGVEFHQVETHLVESRD